MATRRTLRPRNPETGKAECALSHPAPAPTATNAHTAPSTSFQSTRSRSRTPFQTKFEPRDYDDSYFDTKPQFFGEGGGGSGGRQLLLDWTTSADSSSTQNSTQNSFITAPSSFNTKTTLGPAFAGTPGRTGGGTGRRFGGSGGSGSGKTRNRTSVSPSPISREKKAAKESWIQHHRTQHRSHTYTATSACTTPTRQGAPAGGSYFPPADGGGGVQALTVRRRITDWDVAVIKSSPSSSSVFDADMNGILSRLPSFHASEYGGGEDDVATEVDAADSEDASSWGDGRSHRRSRYTATRPEGQLCLRGVAGSPASSSTAPQHPICQCHYCPERLLHRAKIWLIKVRSCVSRIMFYTHWFAVRLVVWGCGLFIAIVGIILLSNAAQTQFFGSAQEASNVRQQTQALESRWRLMQKNPKTALYIEKSKVGRIVLDGDGGGGSGSSSGGSSSPSTAGGRFSFKGGNGRWKWGREVRRKVQSVLEAVRDWGLEEDESDSRTTREILDEVLYGGRIVVPLSPPGGGLAGDVGKRKKVKVVGRTAGDMVTGKKGKGMEDDDW